MYTIKDLIPIALSSNSCEIGEVIFSGKWGSSFEGWKAFDKLENTFWGSEKPVSWLGFRFANKTVVKKYKVNSGGNNTSYAIKKWTFEGSDDGNNWTVLDTQTNQTDWTPAVAKEFDVDNNEEYFYYRINITENNGSNFFTDIVEFVLYGYQPVNKILLLSNDKTYSVYPSYTIDNVVPKMTSNTIPTGTIASASSEVNPAWTAFEGTASSWIMNGKNGWLKVQLSKSALVYSYSIFPQNTSLSRSPKSWKLEGSNDDVNWVILDTQTNQTGWIASTAKEYSISNPVAFSMFRLSISDNNGDASYTSVGDLVLKGKSEAYVNSLPTYSEQNLVNYGMDSPIQVDGIFSNKNYILTQNDSKNTDGLLTTQINRKPLSIKLS